MKKSKFTLNNLKGKITKYIYNVLVDSLDEIACALCSRPHPCSFPFSRIPCSRISLAAELAQNFNHPHHIVFTNTRNPSGEHVFCRLPLVSQHLCLNILSSSPSPLGVECIRHSPLPGIDCPQEGIFICENGICF